MTVSLTFHICTKSSYLISPYLHLSTFEFGITIIPKFFKSVGYEDEIIC